MSESSYSKIIGAGVLLFLLFLITRFIDWGVIRTSPVRSITVTGTAKTQVANQVAQFSAGVMTASEDRDQAIETVNTNIETLIARIKEFGIASDDIQTSNLSIYQEEEPVTQNGRQRFEPGQWRVSNNLTVTLRDISKASTLATLLAEGGATNIYGPNFMVEDVEEAEGALLSEALENARRKAESMQDAMGRKVGRVITIREGSDAGVVAYRADGLGGGGDVPLEPGSQTISKTITVTFELR